MKLPNNIIVSLFLVLLFSSCMKEFLGEKPDKRLVVPVTLNDLQAILDYASVMNNQGTPSAGVVSADEFYVADGAFQSSTLWQRNAYVWAADIFEGAESADWNKPFLQIFYANVVLDRLKEFPESSVEKDTQEEIEGSALFFRAWAYYQLAQIFCNTYDVNESSDLLGLPIRLESDINITPERSSLRATYDRIILDLKSAMQLLPDLPVVKTRPSKAAAYALLARVHLLMENYEEALEYAELTLSLSNTLIDYNTIDTGVNFPLPMFNDEVIFHTTMSTTSMLNQSRLRIDTVLYSLFSSSDLRKQVLFSKEEDGGYTFRGSYGGTKDFFSGIAVNEVILIGAETSSRLGMLEKALSFMDKLLKYRLKDQGLFIGNHEDANSVLRFVLNERRKELLFRGLRWPDLKRFNKSTETQVTLTRVLDDVRIELKPGDPKYVLPIPDREVHMSGLQQNDRQ